MTLLDRVGPLDVLVNSAGMGAARARAGHHRGGLRRGHGGQREGGLCPRAGGRAEDGRSRLRSSRSPARWATWAASTALSIAPASNAVEGMTKAMAIEWGGRGIRVNTICPTFIPHPADRKHLRRSGKTRLDRGQDQAWPGGADRGHHGGGGLSRLGRIGAGHGDGADGGWWLDGGLMAEGHGNRCRAARRGQPERGEPGLQRRAQACRRRWRGASGKSRRSWDTGPTCWRGR